MDDRKTLKKKRDISEILSNAEDLKKRLISGVESSFKSIAERLNEDSAEYLIYAFELPLLKKGNQFPIVSDWGLSGHTPEGIWAVIPQINEQTGDLEYGVELVSSENQLPLPTYSYNRREATSLFSKKVFDQDQLGDQIRLNGLNERLVAVATRTKEGIVFKQPSDEQIVKLRGEEGMLCKLLYSNSDLAFLSDVQDVIDTDLLTYRQKLIYFAVLENLNDLKTELEKDAEADKLKTALYLICEGIRSFLENNTRLARWDKSLGRPSRISEWDGSNLFGLPVEGSIRDAASDIERVIDRTLSKYLELFRHIESIGHIDHAILGSMNIGQLETNEGTIGSAIADIDGVAYGSVINRNPELDSFNRKFSPQKTFAEKGLPTNHLAFLTSDYHLSVGPGSINVAKDSKARESRKENMSRNLSEVKRILKEDGILSVICERPTEDLMEDLIDSLDSSGYEIRERWKTDRSKLKGEAEAAPIKKDMEFVVVTKKQNSKNI